jgi:DNA adenine methylase
MFGVNQHIMQNNSYQLSFWPTEGVQELIAKPFLKWAGGKTQLLEQIARYFPPDLKKGNIQRYVEPFVGSGAVLFYILQNYQVKKFFISDTNEELILTYVTVKECVDELIASLTQLQQKYHRLNFEDQKKFFYNIRSEFNHNRLITDFTKPNIKRSSQLIFLNRTCFNGLFRVNSKGAFNVPFGSYKNPKICFSKNLRTVSTLLKNVEIMHGDFTICEPYINKHSFVYFDPPYRPISQTASFTSYQQLVFNDDSQIRLANFFRKLDLTGAKLMLSNSDPHNYNQKDIFFQTIYEGFQIHKVFAKRMINCNGNNRGKITELLITNYGDSKD